MKASFKSLNVGDFFLFKLDDYDHIYQKISPIVQYNAVHLNTGQLCNIYGENTNINKIKIELSIKQYE